MATVINNPSNGEDSGVAGMVIGIIVLIIAIGIFFIYVLPNTRGTQDAQVEQETETRERVDINVTLPTTGNTDPVEDTDN